MSSPDRPPTLSLREVWLSFVVFLGLTAGLFHEVVLGGATVASAPHTAFTLPEGPVDYPRSTRIPLIDPAGPAWIHEANFPYRDETIRHGKPPFWHPYEACGNPYLAGLLPGLFFPPNLLMHVAPEPLGFDLAYLARVFLAGWFLYLFLRVHRLRRLAAGLGGLLFLGSGYMVLSLNLSNAAVECCVPGLLLGLECLITRSRFRDLVLAVFTVFLVLVGGNPQASFLALLLGGIYAAFRLIGRWCAARATPGGGRAALRTTGRLVLALALAGCLAAPQLLPFVEFVGLSAHTHHPGLGVRTQPWQTLVQWVVPNYFARACGPDAAGRDFYYFGAVALALAVVAVGVRGITGSSRFLTRFSALAFVVVTAWYFGMPGLRQLGSLPGLSQVTVGKYLGVYPCLFIAILAGLGLERILIRRSRAAGWFLVAGAALAGAIPLLFTWLWRRGAMAELASLNLRFGPQDPVVPSYGFLPWVVGALLLLALILVWRPRLGGLVALGIAILSGLTVLHHRPGSYPPRQPLYRPPVFLEALPVDRRNFRIYSPDFVLAPNTATIFGLNDIRFAEALKIDRYARLIQQGFDYPDAYNYFPMLGLRPGVPSHVLSLLAVRYGLSVGPLLPLSPSPLPANGLREFVLYPDQGPGRIHGEMHLAAGQPCTLRLWQIEETGPVIVPGPTLAPGKAQVVEIATPGPPGPDDLVSLGFQSPGRGEMELRDVRWNGCLLDAAALRTGAHLDAFPPVEDRTATRIRTPNVVTLPRNAGTRGPGRTPAVLRFHAKNTGVTSLQVGLVLRKARPVVNTRFDVGESQVSRIEPDALMHTLDLPLPNLPPHPVRLALEVDGRGTIHHLEFRPDGWVECGRFDGIWVYENTRSLPRAFGVYAAEIISDDEVALTRLLDPAFDIRRSVILARRPAILKLPENPPEERPRASVVWEAPGGAQVQVDVHFPSDGLLVLLDNHYPGWHARVDGNPVEVLRANTTFRAVAVPAGSHRVVFCYAPTGWRPGLALAALGLLALGGIGLTALFRRKRHPAPRMDSG
jgi:membrane protein YfhO